MSTGGLLLGRFSTQDEKYTPKKVVQNYWPESDEHIAWKALFQRPLLYHRFPMIEKADWITNETDLVGSLAVYYGRRNERRLVNRQVVDLQKEIDVIAIEASEPNWDHEGAAAVDPDTIAVTKELVALFPKMDALPDVSATPHGEVYFDWAPARDRLLALSVGPPANHEIVFAAMFGNERVSGRQHWSGTLPRFLECCFHHI